MPAKHVSNSYIPTPQLNKTFGIIRSRIKGAPTHPALLALIVQSLIARWKTSLRGEDKHLLLRIESITQLEDYLETNGSDVWQELQKADNGIFQDSLFLLATDYSKSKIPDHDPSILRLQYDGLWLYEEHRHPLPAASSKRNELERKAETEERLGEWLRTYWKACGQVLSEYPCLCKHKSTEPTYSTLYGPKECYGTRKKKDLFDRLLAHLHGSTHGGIDQDMKPSRRKRSTQRK